MTSTTEVTVGEGVKARWVPRNEDSQNQFSDSATLSGASSSLNDAGDTGNAAAQGLMEWVCDVAPGASVDLKLSWEISVPSGTSWVKQ